MCLDVRKGIEFAPYVSSFPRHHIQVVLEGEGESGDIWEGVEGEDEHMDTGVATDPSPDWTDSPSRVGKPAADLV